MPEHEHHGKQESHSTPDQRGSWQGVGEARLRNHPKKGVRSKRLIELIGLAVIGALSVVFLMGFDRIVNVTCGQDLDARVNADDPTIGTLFQLEGPCTYNVDATVALRNGDEIRGPQGTFIERGPAFDPQPTVEIVASTGPSNVIRADGTVRLEWVKLVGGTGQYSGGSPVAGTGSGIAMGSASNNSSLYAVHVTQSDAAGITNAHGTFDRIEVSDTTQDPNFLGFTAAGLKAGTEVEIRNSYAHDNPGNGLWCDSGCDDASNMPNGFWVHDNLLVDNGRAGVRYENSATSALIENNEVHGNSYAANRGGVSIRDAQNATIRNNVFGPATIAGVTYRANDVAAIHASDSGRADRPDLLNVDIYNNVLNGEVIVGCELPDTAVDCSNADPPPPGPNANPYVISTNPGPNAGMGSTQPPAPTPTTNVTATFSEDMDPSSITRSTFRLTRQGSTKRIGAVVSYSVSTDTATLDPTNSLRSGVTYRAVVTTGAQDVDGNPLDQNPNTGGLQQMEWFFKIA